MCLAEALVVLSDLTEPLWEVSHGYGWGGQWHQREYITVNLINTISVFITHILEHTFCVLKNMVIFFYSTLQHSLHHLLTDHILPKRQLFFPPLNGNYHTLFNPLFLSSFPPTRQGVILYIHYLAQYLKHKRYSLPIERERTEGRQSEWERKRREGAIESSQWVQCKKHRKGHRPDGLWHYCHQHMGYRSSVLMREHWRLIPGHTAYLQILFCKCVYVINYIPFSFQDVSSKDLLKVTKVFMKPKLISPFEYCYRPG